MAKAPTKKAKAKKGFEDTLWDTANQLRGSVESSEYKHVVLSLVFLKFISDKFEARRQKMKDEGQGDFLEMEVFYQQDNIFYLPEERAGRSSSKTPNRMILPCVLIPRSPPLRSATRR
jgi:type I restriction enzyme M protein